MPHWFDRRAQSKELVFVGFGGSYQDGQTKAYIEPFEKETGLKVTQTSGVELAKLRAQVQANHVEWDVTTLPDRLLFLAMHDDLLMRLGYKVIDTDNIIKEVVRPHSIAHVTLAMALTYSTKFYPSGKEPKNWAGFWNLDGVPGIRGMYNFPAYALEMALVADGVPKDKLYQLDVARAFKSLDKIKSKVVCWDQFPQPGILLQSRVPAPLGGAPGHCAAGGVESDRGGRLPLLGGGLRAGCGGATIRASHRLRVVRGRRSGRGCRCRAGDANRRRSGWRWRDRNVGLRERRARHQPKGGRTGQ